MERVRFGLGTAAALLLLCTASAAADTGGVLTVTATVQPVRSVIVNRERIITGIYSNTSQSVAPTVHLLSDDGPSMDMTPFIQQQYARILPTLDLSHTGLIYDNAKVDRFSILYLNAAPTSR